MMWPFLSKKPKQDTAATLSVQNTGYVQCREMPEDVGELCQKWFSGRISQFEQTGERSIYIPYEFQRFDRIKIKGAGLNGSAIQFGTYLERGPVAPLFDFDGRAMMDVASGHDGAYVGGSSMQQAVTEYRMSHLLTKLGFSTVPCLGYGQVHQNGHSSWFTVYGWRTSWIDSVKPPQGDVQTYRAMTIRNSEIALELARKHRLIGNFWMVRNEDGDYLLKDLHLFRRADPLNMSQVSWVMQTYFALHITAISTRLLCQKWHDEDVAQEAPLWMIWPFCPEATLEDWDLLRFRVVAKYMLQSHPAFDPEQLCDLLRSNPITARIMDLCPTEFEAR
ncbi:hypothetical protein BOO69_11220 [Sulfitobacter alexandrii]|uniref:Uncharacterized protein n=1 Tax=Sulfitobacter alexandrii TaxID=1917485 RepID=A0A1J0WHY3_9RHOB|nr:hypothetical protein [Sulfitobacter alexandrii]APE43915.1 hypothetical protein BOO69_11220 [Sulfitobacter alexandrii]